MKRIFIIAGETSGDMHGSTLIRAMREQSEETLEFFGIGGKRMVEEGLDAIRHVRDMNIMGFVEVVKHLPFIWRAMKDLERALDETPPDIAILIDYPGFNLKFAPQIKKRNIPLMYYISPQLWAWHKSRVNLIRKHVDRMVVLFDFEKPFYESHGVDAVDFVGHPLVEHVKPSKSRDEFRTMLGVADDEKLVGFLPGSRAQEIERIFPAMMASVPIMAKRFGKVRFVVGCASELDESVYTPFVETVDETVQLVSGESYNVMAHSDAVAVTSGTATVETGILGTPMVIMYRTSFLTYNLGRLLVDIDNIGMINIIAGQRIVPELWQDEVTGPNIADKLEPFLCDPMYNAETREKLADTRKKLGGTGASQRAARAALELLRKQNNR